MNTNNIKISGYVTSRNALNMNYPVRESIESVLQFVDEVVVVDTSDGSDKTKDFLNDEIAAKYPLEVVKIINASNKFDWSLPNHGIYDGQTKALARIRCSGDFLFQFDLDEVMHEDDACKIKPLIEKLNYLRDCSIVALPVIDFWGCNGKARVDVNPWKSRLSRNTPDITHGIPIQLRKKMNGLDYTSPGTDGCDYISRYTGQMLPVSNPFMTEQAEMCRRAALLGNTKTLGWYEKWLTETSINFPGVFHYSWYGLKRKIENYRDFYTSFWKALYGPDSEQNKDPDWNPFFEIPWRDVTDEMIKQKAIDLETKTGGHIFHTRWNGEYTPSVKFNREHPARMKEWIEKNKETHE